ncbi:hypothetical protein C6503_23360 [Candidatus Poribacteria bacterium]|nr:MAG: hypothetical protein C6503_23360 [Candidatus Poribacteria bacterium]
MKKQLIGFIFLFLICLLMPFVAMADLSVVVINSPGAGDPGDWLTFIVEVREDRSPLSGQTVTFSIEPDDGTLSVLGGLTSTVTGNNGRSSATLVLGDDASGTYTVTASSGTASVSRTVTVGTLPPLSISISSSNSNANPGDTVTFTATVTENNNPASGQALTFGIIRYTGTSTDIDFIPVAGTASLSSTSATTDSNGKASTSLSIGSDASGSYSVSATLSDGRLDVATVTVEASASPPLSPEVILLSISTNNSNFEPGDTVTFTVEAKKDTNPAPDQSVIFSVSPDDGTASLSPTSATTDGDGEAQTTLNLGTDASGSYTVTASVGTTSTSTIVEVEVPRVAQRQQHTNPNAGAQGAASTRQNTAQQPVQLPIQRNNLPVFSDGASTTRSIAENTGADIAIGNPISATDADSGDTLTYSLSGTDASSFSIDSSTGQLRTAAALDYETKNTYDVTVNVSDSNGGSDSIAVTINITDINENRPPVQRSVQPSVQPPDDTQQPPATQNNPPVFTDGASTTRSISENTSSGASIGAAVSATDADGDTLTYTLSGTDAAAFRIVSTTGQLQTSAALDYETKTSYTVTVTVSDGKGGTDSISVTINVTDVSEAVVQPSTPPSSGGTQQSNTPPVQPPVQPPQQQPDDSGNGNTEPIEEDTQDEEDTQEQKNTTQEDTQPTVQPPTNNQSSGGGGTLPKPVTPVNHTIKPFDYEREGVGKVVFSEWMLSSLNNMPQWIEVYNTTDKDINLRDWKIVGRYMDGDENVHILESHTLKSLTVKAKQAGLIVSYSASLYGGSFSKNLQGKVSALQSSQRLWTGKAIVLELQDDEGNPVDRIGNLNENDERQWRISARTRSSVNKDRRISLVRRLKSVKSRKYNFRFGMAKFGWFPADEVDALTESKRSKYYYGHPTDIGTPGYRTEGADPLPVTLSSFIPQIAEDGGVVLSWTTASEIENAGFNIFRSEAKQGPFVKVNARLIQGAGTTSERNAYSWTDTTAKTNIEYYYRLEDMSFDGISELLTTQRLKGIFTAKNRSLTRWAILKKGTK